MDPDVLVLGGGAAGLSAARTLIEAGRSVVVLEAGESPGGRMRTLDVPGLGPVELGAEFVHGAAPITKALLRKVRGKKQPMAGRAYRADAGGPRRADADFGLLGEVLGQLEPEPDRPVRQAIVASDASDDAKAFTLAFLQGFDALDPDRASIRAVLEEEGGDPGSGAIDSFRVLTGQAPLLGPLVEGVDLRTRTEVVAVRHGARVEVQVRTPFGTDVLRAGKAIVALPLGVLPHIRFDPPLSWPLDAMAPGGAQRIVLAFRSRFWEESAPKLGFLNGDGVFRVLWADRHRPVLTAWCGGPPAWELSSLPEIERVRRAVADLAANLGIRPEVVQGELRSWYTHDWQSDPRFRGAYSYVTVGGVDRVSELAEPRGSLALAGEYVGGESVSGTVEAALASGRRAGEWAG